MKYSLLFLSILLPFAVFGKSITLSFPPNSAQLDYRLPIEPEIEALYKNLASYSQLQVNVGTPAQTVLLFPCESTEHTLLVANGSCNSFYCEYNAGGLFAENDSDTWTVVDANPDLRNAFAGDFWDATNFTSGTDSISFSDDVSIEEYPVVLATMDPKSNVMPAMGFLGISRNSSFLNSLVENGQIDKKVWGYHNGTYDFGEMDEKRFSGEVYSYGLPEDGKALKVRVKNIDVNGKSLMDGVQDPFDARLSISMWSTQFPQPVFNKFWSDVYNNRTFEHSPSGFGISEVENGNRTDGPIYLGDTVARTNYTITVTLDNGFTFTVLEEEIRSQMMRVSDSTTWEDAEYSMLNIFTTEGDYANTMSVPPYGVEPGLPVFGAQWLTDMYLMVDYERGVLEIAESTERRALNGSLVGEGNGRDESDNSDGTGSAASLHPSLRWVTALGVACAAYLL
jgi:hypothetical protein